jgi:pyridoxamine 5'-phosphate oxidase
MENDIAAIRTEYKQHVLLEESAAPNALDQFGRWWSDALNSKIDEVNAMMLATITETGNPTARIVLLKSFDAAGFVFFTNYNSHKGMEMTQHPQACLLFFWKELERQVRINGFMEKVSAAESDEYFYSRPEGSRLGAHVSPQSQTIPNREWLDDKEKELNERYADKPVPRPEHWGGYRLIPSAIEFWQGRPNRLHDRLLYLLPENGNWAITRLAP